MMMVVHFVYTCVLCQGSNSKVAGSDHGAPACGKRHLHCSGFVGCMLWPTLGSPVPPMTVLCCTLSDRGLVAAHHTAPRMIWSLGIGGCNCDCVEEAAKHLATHTCKHGAHLVFVLFA